MGSWEYDEYMSDLYMVRSARRNLLFYVVISILFVAIGLLGLGILVGIPKFRSDPFTWIMLSGLVAPLVCWRAYKNDANWYLVRLADRKAL